MTLEEKRKQYLQEKEKEKQMKLLEFEMEKVKKMREKEEEKARKKDERERVKYFSIMYNFERNILDDNFIFKQKKIKLYLKMRDEIYFLWKNNIDIFS